MRKTIIVIVILLIAIGGWFYMKNTNSKNAYVPTQNQIDTNLQATTTANEATTTNTTTKTYSLTEVAKHSDSTSCYTTIRGFVYDITSYISKHPGGSEKILQICGKDGTELFVAKHGGKAIQEQILDGFKIGVLAN